MKILHSAEQNQILKEEQNHNDTASNTNVFILWKSAQYFFFHYYFHLHLSSRFLSLQDKQNSHTSEV